MLSPEEHLERMSGILRHDIGPAVADPFPKTQAFMASVVLEKLARQLRTRSAHETAERNDMAELGVALAAEIGPGDPEGLRHAVSSLHDGPVGPALSRAVAELYAGRDQLSPDRFDHLLTLVRRTLRARLDRQLEYAS